MANPVLSKPDAFTRSSQYQGPQASYPQTQFPQQGYGQAYPQQGYAPAQPAGDRMSLDDVIAKTAITMLVLAVSAGATWFLMPSLTMVMPIMIVSMIVGLITVVIVSRRQEIPIGGVLFYAVVEGVFVGAISKLFETLYPGIVAQAVLATFVAAAMVLAAYKFFNIRVTPKFQKIVFLATAAFAGVMLVNLVLVLLNVQTGLVMIGSSAGWLAYAVSAVAIVLAVMNLIVDFDSVERGIAQGAPARESWRAAFGMTITMVWLYIEILRVLSYFRN